MLKSECMIFSSSSENGALNKSNNNDEFSVQFTNPIFLPPNASNARLEIISAQIWNNSPNITSANNKIVFVDPNGKHEIFIEIGLYDYVSLFQQIALQYDNKSVNPIPYWRLEDVLQFVGNYSTQKLSIAFLYYNDAKINQLQIIWNESTITSLLGFTNQSPTRPSKVSTASVNYSLTSDTYAKFNTYNSFLIQSDLVSVGIPINNTNYNNIIGQVPIPTDSLGTLVNFEAGPKNIFAMCNNLIGINNAKYSARFKITDENNGTLIMPDDFVFSIMISWFESE
jgi:hypothetical protein